MHGMDPPDGDGPPLPRPTSPPTWRDHLDRLRTEAGDRFEIDGRVRLVISALALVAALGTVWWLARPQPAEVPLEALLPTVGAVTPPAEPTSPTIPQIIVVHVAGAVRAPGLVEVSAGARVADAVAAAGGPTPTADLDRINLAVVLTDAAFVHVPEVGEEAPLPPGGALTVEPGTGPLDLNTASEAEFDELPGIGPATAAAIVAHRAEHGAFTSVTALQDVPGIGPAKLASLRDLVTVR